MEADQQVKKQNSVVRFIISPFRNKYPPPMTHVGDFLAAAGLVLFVISVFALKWIKISLNDVMGIGKALGVKAPQARYGLFESPWAWVMVGVLVVLVLGIYFVQTRGGVTLGVGIFCIIFNIIFFIGVWKKINGIIGNVVGLAKSVPVIGQFLGQALTLLTKELLSVHVAAGYWLMIPAGILIMAGGALRLASKPRMLPDGAAS
jgi:hypothetical protein